ncbi:M3 family oligoendopeptidase [Novosphingobium decolorationis]|uniref:Oligoendopeptidase F family protein n=1 Tax=Novosphingobium decolorationis TaxID=2698673 RepID=A0ABX8E734_9SPHN|nr:M3 family oligoendopeptidase [Novosphingobium decolorationis]QVM84849.1 oligoendopeptidase F family protein [Novosphingobium decolorationis]
MFALDRRKALGLAASLPVAASLTGLRAYGAHGAEVPSGSGAAWDLTDLFPDAQAWDVARKAVLAALPRLAAYKGTLGRNAQALARALDDISVTKLKAMRVYVYSSLQADEDVRAPAPQEREAQARDMFSQMGQATAWVDPEVLDLGEATIERFIAENDTLQRRFAFPLRDTLRRAEHILDDQGEAILASASAALAGPGSVRDQLVASDIPWPTITLSDEREVRLDAQGYSHSRDVANRADRKRVFDSYWSAFKGYEGSLGAALAAKLKGDVFEAENRGYESCLAMALAANRIPEGVYRSLVAEVNAGLPQLHRYFQLRRRMLNLPDIHYYDIYPPLVQMDRTFTLGDMRNVVLEALKPLGSDYVRQMGEATAKTWMDPFPRPGKRAGAYMNGAVYDVHPYLLLNLSENFDGVSTFVHEWGHAMHTLIAAKAQPYETARYPTFLAEIASTANEVFLTEYMLERAKTKEEKLYYLGMRLEGLRGTFFRQTMFAEFELKIHEMAEAGEGLSGASISRIYAGILRRYHGPDFTIDAPYEMEWAMIGHFYRFFYVYQYATSITAGTWFARSVLDGGKAERENFLGVLRAGGSDYPTDILKRAGLDMASPQPYRDLVAGFGRTLNEIEALLDA